MDEWTGPVRSGHPEDACPVCGKPCIIATDFKKFGEHRIRFCLTDGAFENGKKINTIDVYGGA